MSKFSPASIISFDPCDKSSRELVERVVLSLNDTFHDLAADVRLAYSEEPSEMGDHPMPVVTMLQKAAQPPQAE